MAATHNKLCQLGLMAVGVILISACSTSPPQAIVTPTSIIQEAKPQRYTTPTGVTIIPYDIEPIMRKSL